jgi:pyruvate formate lyase activating enzyme
VAPKISSKQFERSGSGMDARRGLVFDIQRFSIHDGPGIRTTVFLKGCPLRCAWCSNPESREPYPQVLRDPASGAETVAGRGYTVEEIVAVCERDRPFYEESGGGVTLSGGEALMQHRFALAVLARLRQAGIHTTLETTGHVAPAVFLAALDHLDLLIIDVKQHDRAEHRRWTGRFNDLPLLNLRTAVARAVPMLVRIPVVPGVNDALADAGAFARLLAATGVHEVQLLPFHQLGERKHALLGVPYPLADRPALHPEDLTGYRMAFQREGVTADC